MNKYKEPELTGRLVKNNYEYSLLVNNNVFASSDPNIDGVFFLLDKAQCEDVIFLNEIDKIWKQYFEGKFCESKQEVIRDSFQLGARTIHLARKSNSFSLPQIKLAISTAKENPELSTEAIIEKIIEFDKFQTSCDIEVAVVTTEGDNQCDGCKAEHEYTNSPFPAHLNPTTNKVYMNCQKAMYNPPKLSETGCITLKLV